MKEVRLASKMHCRGSSLLILPTRNPIRRDNQSFLVLFVDVYPVVGWLEAPHGRQNGIS